MLLGIVGIQDPLREGVVESVQAFQRAGVFIRMVWRMPFYVLCSLLTPPADHRRQY